MDEPRIGGSAPNIDEDPTNVATSTWENYVTIIYEPEVDSECPFRCGVCGMTFVTARHFRWHATCHTGNAEWRCCFKCSICGGISARFKHLKEHRLIHGKNDYLECCKYENCKKKFIQKSELELHERIHRDKVASIQGSNSMAVPSNFVDYTLQIRRNYHKILVKVVEHEINSWKRSDPTECTCIEHRLAIHERNSDLECCFKCTYENCRKIFTQKAEMELHKRTQIDKDDLGWYRFECEICKLKFVQRNNYIRHIRTQHRAKTDALRRPFRRL